MKKYKIIIIGVLTIIIMDTNAQVQKDTIKNLGPIKAIGYNIMVADSIISKNHCLLKRNSDSTVCLILRFPDDNYSVQYNRAKHIHLGNNEYKFFLPEKQLEEFITIKFSSADFNNVKEIMGP